MASCYMLSLLSMSALSVYCHLMTEYMEAAARSIYSTQAMMVVAAVILLASLHCCFRVLALAEDRQRLLHEDLWAHTCLTE